MDNTDIIFTPHSDMSLDNSTVVAQHKTLIDNSNYSDATTLLNNNNYSDGFRASIFNLMEAKIQKIQLYLLNKFADPEDFYSVEEPTVAQMEGKTYWKQLY